jgi:hypothetical protein
MHDCPNCRTPLHGHEEVCPACGAGQYVRRGFNASSHVEQAPAVNWMPFVLVIVVVGAGLFIAAQSTWLGQLMKQGPRQEDPMEKLSFMDARNMIEQKLTEGLTAVGAKGKFTWATADGTAADKSAAGNIQLTVDTKLKDMNSRHAILDPVKPFMDKALVTTLTMNDSKSHATWTLTVQPSARQGQSEEPSDFDSFKRQQADEEQKEQQRQQAQDNSFSQQYQQQQGQQQNQQQQSQQPAQQQQYQQPAQQQQQQQPQQQAPQQEKMPWDTDQQGSQ